jgi:RNA polymerase sigma-70 factor (ECF subfamily)
MNSGQPSSAIAELERLEDDELMARLRDGHHDALAVLFDRYHRLVLSISLRIVRDPGEAEDVTQNVFLEIFKSVRQFDPAKGNTKTWILQYAYHRAINRRQHLNVRSFYDQSPLDESLELFAGKRSVLAGLSPEESRQLVVQSLAALNGSQKKVIELASYDGLSMSEIAEKTGESVSNVRHHYYRGLQKLRSFISEAPKRSQ